MSNHYKALAEKIHQQADAVLQRKNIPALLNSMGRLYFTGSYALDLMTWNDIDMHLIIEKEKVPAEVLVKILSTFTQENDFLEGRIIHFTGDYKPQWPRGYCLCLKINVPDLGGIWKFDLWILPKEEVDTNQALVAQLQQGLTDRTRELILELKCELMKPSGRVPKKGSYWLYQAILIHGLSEKKPIFDFLRSKGVLVEGVIT